MVLYWYAASVKYGVPLFALTMYLLLLLHAAFRPVGRFRYALLTLVGGALCFASAGFAETMSIALLIGLSILFGALWFARGHLWKRCQAIIVAGWFATAAGMLLMVTAPGVALRLGWEHDRSPILVNVTTGELFSQTWNIWLDRVSDPAVFAAFALSLAAGLIAALAFARTVRTNGGTRQLARNPLLFGLAMQLLLLPLVWLHQSIESTVLGRFSTAYSVVLVCNIGLIGGLLLLLWQRERVNAILRGREHILPSVALAIMLLIFALTQFRSIHWRANLYLWASCQSLLLVLAWLLSRRLPKAWSGGFAIGMGCLYAITWVAIAAIAFVGLYASGRDIERTFTFAAYLIVWQGLAWGVFLGYAVRAGYAATDERANWLLQFGAVLVTLALLGGIVADQLAMVPKFQQYASDYDARHTRIIAQRDAGQRHITVARLSFDLTRYLKVARLHHNRCPLQYYDVDVIELEEP